MRSYHYEAILRHLHLSDIQLSAMSTSSSATGVDTGAENTPPQLSALFLIRFDKKVGYTIAWKRSSVHVPLDGAVEFKSLPSGLHTVKNDLVYFVHQGYAGLSAYAKGAASAEERNAEFVSVGILVSRAYGRLGRSWLLAARLRSIAATLAGDPSATAPLEEFWEEQSAHQASGSAQGKTDKAQQQQQQQQQHKTHSRARALSTITDVTPSDTSLPPFHPALSMLQYVEMFGPLVFRLQQAALLRKRILFVGSPPVRNSCEFVYDLSVLSSIPPHATEFLSPGTDSLLRLPALFSIGVNDITELEQMNSAKAGDISSEASDVPVQGWVANTTDEIITMKKQLYDIVVEMPPTYDAPPEQRQWPTMKTSDGAPIKASQRDMARFKMLWRELRRHEQEVASARGEGEDYENDDDDDGNNDDNDDQAALLPRHKTSAGDGVDSSIGEQTVEPITWSQLAYNGFMWWASAGEQHAYTSGERDRDLDLLGDLSDYGEGLPTAIIAYFHRSTTQLINGVNSVIEGADDDDNGNEDEEVVVVDKEDLSRMGLDTWSEADRAFLSEFVWMWFGRIIEVRGTSIDCCGVRIPVP
ncbi:unnamed protein product [Periconia digitata]|uniref:DUF4484 domain-containing protein n=1 Tax=Periconia digitata TaxID=1303443 RepID=A0A9W4XQ65_9PLEO|nr:unnamed protein product [Periconia digitata]